LLEKIKDESYKKPEGYNSYTNPIIKPSTEDEFHIGQCYEEEPASRLECKVCGSKQFIVGQGSYYTALKCPTCLWEICIHDG